MNFIQAITYTMNSCKRAFVKNKPRIFMVGGIGLTTAGTITACAATYKHIDRILDTTKERMEKAETSENPGKEKSGNVYLVSINGNDELKEEFYKKDSDIQVTYYEDKAVDEIAAEHPGEIQPLEGYKFFQ